MHIARQPLSVPANPAAPFEAQERLKGTPPAFVWVESDRGPWLLAIDGQHGGIQVEDHLPPAQKTAAAAVVQSAKGRQAVLTEARQKAAQRAWIGVAA